MEILALRREYANLRSRNKQRRSTVKQPPVIILTPDDAVRYARLRNQMLRAEPWAFAQSPLEESAMVADVAGKLADPRNVVVAGTNDAGQALVGGAGLRRGEAPKFHHRALFWGLFVDPDHRRCGYGRALVDTAIRRARQWGVEFVDLSVSEKSTEAFELYSRVGFVTWGSEPEATQIDGERYDEIHMTLRLVPIHGPGQTATGAHSRAR